MYLEYRAKSVEEVGKGHWVYGSCLRNEDEGEGECTFIYGGGWEFHNIPLGLILVDPKTLGMFTGKLDTNKKKIFLGDIVEGKFPYASRGLIVWDDKRCGFFVEPIGGFASYDPYYKMNANKLTVIGNIHDDEELLNHIE